MTSDWCSAGVDVELALLALYINDWMKELMALRPSLKVIRG